MALYFDTIKILTTGKEQGSLKSRIYNDKDLKSKPAQVFALISETAKYDAFLKEVLDNAGLLRDEQKLTPELAILLAHDFFFSKAGIAAPSKHPIRQAFETHRARLQAEFTRARLRRKCPTTEVLKKYLAESRGSGNRRHPRWARVSALGDEHANDRIQNLLTGLQAGTLDEVVSTANYGQYYHLDVHVPGLIAFPPNHDLTSTQEYRDGIIILQDKASCFPAHLLLGNEDNLSNVRDVMDGCAAPGNKTTHLAALMISNGHSGRVLACERDEKRSKILQSMVAKAGANKQVDIIAPQDFLALRSDDARIKEVTHLLLDPSCSGSGILDREEIPQLALPEDLRAKAINNNHTTRKTKKRKRKQQEEQETIPSTSTDLEQVPQAVVTEQRLQKLSNLQSHVVEHAMSFPIATKITYSTCSIHQEENEIVVSRALASNVARERGWRVFRREHQVSGIQSWKHRGIKTPEGQKKGNTLIGEQLDACVRCYPNDDEGTMGFFVCGFVRDAIPPKPLDCKSKSDVEQDFNGEDWEGFDD